MAASQIYRERNDSMSKAPLSIKATSSDTWLINTVSTQVTPRRLHWWTPTLLTASFATGIFAALSQHILYRSIHRKSDQTENRKTTLIFCGRVLSYLANIAFAQAIIISYNQRIWKTVKRHDLSLRSIDRLFSGTEDLSLFFSFEILRAAPLVTCMALVLRILPIATIIASPSALSVGLRAQDSEVSLPVLTVDFGAESNYNWRKPVKTEDGETKRSLMYYNTTDAYGQQPGWFDYYDQPSQELSRLINLNIFSSPGEILNSTFNQEGTRQEVCGGQYNCTYTVTFLGPSYRCEDYSQDTASPFDAGLIFPQGTYRYYADVDTADYVRPQIDNVAEGPGGIPVGSVPPHAGYLRFEPELWIGYSLNTTNTLSPDSVHPENNTKLFEPRIARCIHYEAKYTIAFNFTSQICLTNVTTEFLKPILGSDFSEKYSGNLPEDNWISPQADVERYKKSAAYHAIGEVFRSFIRGNVEYHRTSSGSSYNSVNSDISKTSLLDRGTPRPDMIVRLQELYQGIIVTLLTQRQFLVNDKEQVMVRRTQYQIAFIYDPMRLWLCYAPVILLSLIILLIGAWTIWEDKATMSTTFSRILATTRNPTLDYMARGVCSGKDAFPEEIMRTKLRFGPLYEANEKRYGESGADVDDDTRHCAFGTPSEVGVMQKHG